MQLQPVKTTQHKARLALQGVSGSGKTYSALLLAFGLTGAFEKVAILDTDGAAALYSYLGPFNTLSLAPPYTPQKFVEAMELCQRSGIEAIILDTISAEWTDEGGVLESMRESEDPFAAIDAHMDFIRELRNCPIHLIATLRTKEVYHLTVAGGKKDVQKIGLEPLQQEGIHYHFQTILALDMKHRAVALKDRTSFFEEHGTVVVTEEIAALYARWCGEAERTSVPPQVQERISGCSTLQELLELLLQTEVADVTTLQAFIKRKQVLAETTVNTIIKQHNSNHNGTDHYRATA